MKEKQIERLFRKVEGLDTKIKEKRKKKGGEIKENY